MKLAGALTASGAVALTMGTNSGTGIAAGTADFGPSNPFHAPSTLPLRAPPFDKIKDSDYQPAIEAGMALQLAEIQRIANDASQPTFANTFIALEKSGAVLQRALDTFSAVSDADNNPLLQKTKTALAPKLAAHEDSIYLNEKLFERVASVHERRGSLQLDPESLRLVEITYDEFVHSGAKLREADKAKLKTLNEELSTLSDTFSTKLLEATKEGALVTTDAVSLAGLSKGQLSAAAQAARSRKVDGYLLPLQNTTQQPELASLSVRATRAAIFRKSWNRSERGDANDTRATIAQIAHIRATRAELLGYSSHAAWKLEDQMAKTPSAALAFMDALVPLATAKAQHEAADIQSMIDAHKGGFALEPWDWNYYAEQVRKSRYALDEAEIKPYFELDAVLENGVFYAASQLYGIRFRERKDLPVYHPDVRAFEVIDTDGTTLALFYCDYFKRDNKNGGAWMSNFVNASTLLGTRPVIYNVANFSKPSPGEPALISFDDVITMFHEFGHALHGMFADTKYPSLSGTATPSDFVEFPSQFNEHWATYPAIFEHFARHYRTGASMPAALADKLRKTKDFNRGYGMTELLAAAELDMQWHVLPASAPLQNPDVFETQALARTHLDLHAVPPRYRSSYFRHIWGGDYSAGYYAYLWTQMLADDAYEWFDENGGLTRSNGDRLRRMVLSRGNTEELGKLYADWRGRPATVDAMMRYRGLR